MREVANTRRNSHHVAGLWSVDVGVVAHLDSHVPLLPQGVARQKLALVQGEQIPCGSRGVVLRLRGARDLYARLGVAPLGEAGAVERPGDRRRALRHVRHAPRGQLVALRPQDRRQRRPVQDGRGRPDPAEHAAEGYQGGALAGKAADSQSEQKNVSKKRLVFPGQIVKTSLFNCKSQGALSFKDVSVSR